MSLSNYHNIITGLTTVVGLDIQDENGRHEVGFVDNTDKVAIEAGQGCRLESQFQINKVAGNFHVSTHSAKVQPNNIDMTHRIEEVSFGDPMDSYSVEASFNPLRHMDKTGAQGMSAIRTTWLYFMHGWQTHRSRVDQL